jgi:hypothetical protein
MSGADWLVGDVGKKGPPKKLQRAPEPLAVDDAVRYLEDAAGDGKRLVAGLKSATSALDALRASGLTGEALVVLVTAKCAYSKVNGRPISEATVQQVLEGLFRLGEYSR